MKSPDHSKSGTGQAGQADPDFTPAQALRALVLGVALGVAIPELPSIARALLAAASIEAPQPAPHGRTGG